MTKDKKIVPIFFATDDNYVPFLCVALNSLIKKASKNYRYNIHVLNPGLKEESKKALSKYRSKNVKIYFNNMYFKLKNLDEELPTRDYYTTAIFYRMFIPEMFPQYSKALYLDCDIALNGDISELFETDISDNYLGAVTDEAVSIVPEFIEYVENFLGVKQPDYLNSGILIMNLNVLRKEKFEKKFLHLLKQYKFIVAPDQDYLNVICPGRVHKLSKIWNKMPIIPDLPLKDVKIVHYNLSFKPWHYDNIPYDELFWENAKETEFFQTIKNIRQGFTDEMAAGDKEASENLIRMTHELAISDNAYLKLFKKGEINMYSVENAAEMQKNPERLKILEKISEYEKKGAFDKDVEEDPPFQVLQPNEIDFLKKKFMSKFKTYIANKVANRFYKKTIKQKQVIFSGVTGHENLKGFKGGAIITCNHCHFFDNYAVYLSLKKFFKKKFRNFRMYKVVKESNYSLPGKIGFFMKNCDTLPLSSNLKTTAECMNAIKVLLKKKKKILIYPEQSMWWNYRKPRPLKNGAYKLAAKFNAPIIPCFITLKNSDIIDPDGFPVQEFTVHILPIIYPDKNVPINEDCESMKNKNQELWNEMYEKVYNEKLTFENEQIGMQA